MRFLILMTLFISTNVFADISGHWTGQGEWTYEGSGQHCFMNMSFKENQNKIERVGGSLDCDMVSLGIDSLTLTRSGKDLLDENNNIVGSYENDTLKMTEAYSESVDIKTEIKVNGLHFDYQERWVLKTGDEIYNITGRLFTASHE
jgi:hypothetical protein